MPHQQRHSRGDKKRKTTRRRDESARKNVVSLRISDQEKEVLEKFSRSGSGNVSDIVRQAIELWLSKHQTLCKET